MTLFVHPQQHNQQQNDRMNLKMDLGFCATWIF